MRIFLLETQREGGREYPAGQYVNAHYSIANEWIDAGLAYKATKDNTHVVPEPEPEPQPQPEPEELDDAEDSTDEND